MPLADLAIRTDHELADALRALGHPDPVAGVVHARREAAFQEPPAGVGIDATQRMLRQALRSAQAGDFRSADRHALDAYLQGFEPLEPRLRVRDPQGTLAVEEAFGRLRGAIARGDASDARRGTAGRWKRSSRGWAAAPRSRPLRGGVRHLLPRRGGGRAAGGRAAGGPGADGPPGRAAVHPLRMAGRAARGSAHLVAGRARDPAGRGPARAGRGRRRTAGRGGAVLRELLDDLEGRSRATGWATCAASSRPTLSRRSLSLLAGLSFLAVYREAAETILFTQALLLESAGRQGQVWTGALLGLAAVAAIGVAMGRSVMRLPLGPFFAVSGVLLCLLAVSFAGSGLHELVAGGYLRPRPVRFPTVPWLGLYPDLNGLLVQLAIVCGHRALGRGRAAAPGRGAAGSPPRERTRSELVTPPRDLTLLGSPGCHLCHDMRAVVESVAPALGFTLRERDVRESDEWKAYRLEIPVLLADGREIARHRITAAELERLLAARSEGCVACDASAQGVFGNSRRSWSRNVAAPCRSPAASAARIAPESAWARYGLWGSSATSVSNVSRARCGCWSRSRLSPRSESSSPFCSGERGAGRPRGARTRRRPRTARPHTRRRRAAAGRPPESSSGRYSSPRAANRRTSSPWG